MPRTKGALGKWKPEVLLANKGKLQRKAVQMALGGNETCMRICMDRLYPRLRNIAAPIKVDSDTNDLAAQGSAIIDAALSGGITPDVLRDLLSALADQARLKEFSEVEARLAALESQKDAPPWAKQPDRVLPIRGKRRRTAK